MEDFGWALAKMEDEYAVRRKGQQWSLHRQDDALIYVAPNTVAVMTSIDTDDILANDWELAE